MEDYIKPDFTNVDTSYRGIVLGPPTYKKTRYSYDPLGNLLTVAAPDGNITKQSYDAQSRLTEVIYSNDQRASFTYDKLGGLVSMKDWNGDTGVKRDKLGQIVSVTDPKGRTVNYTWTPTGLKDTLTTPDGQKVAYSYDAMQRLTTVTDKAGTTRYTYNTVGQVTEKKSANGSITAYEYNNDGLLQQMNERNKAGEVINQHTYRYDDAGNILGWIEKVGGTTHDKQYTYDELDQLIQAIDNGQTNKYRYDSYGNRISKNAGSTETTYTYNAANQLQQEKTGAVSKNYQYDKRGNLTSVQGGQDQEKYTYDAANNLVGVIKNGTSQEYRYNAQGARIQSKDVLASKTQDFLIDVTSSYNDLLSVYEGNDLKESYTYGLNRLHAYLSDGSNETYSYDHLGSIVGLQDGQGKLKESYHYDEFGILDNSTPPSNQLAVNFGYTGYPNEGNGLYFAQARYYSPEIGRFVSEDTYEGSISNPLSLNLYTYVENNPVRYVDPSGNYCVSPDGRNAHYGMCNVESNISNYYIPDFLIGAGFPEIVDSKVLGYYDYDKNSDMYFVQSNKVYYSTFWKEANLSEKDYYYDWVLAIPLADAVYGSMASVRLPSTVKIITKLPTTKLPTTKLPTAKKGTIKGKGNVPKQTITSNKGNNFNVTPSSNHTTVTKNPGPTGKPNSSIDIIDPKTGEVLTRRWYGPDGRATRDVDYTHHKNPKTHPEAPHQHTWTYDKNGNPDRSK